MRKTLTALLLFLLVPATLSGCTSTVPENTPSSALTGGAVDIAVGSIPDWATPVTQTFSLPIGDTYEKFLSLTESSSLEEATAVIGFEPQPVDNLDNYYNRDKFGFQPAIASAPPLAYYAWAFCDSNERIEIAVNEEGLLFKAYVAEQFPDDVPQATSDLPAAYHAAVITAPLEDVFRTLADSIPMSLIHDVRGPGTAYHEVKYADWLFGDTNAGDFALQFVNGELYYKSITYALPDTNNEPISEDQLDAVHTLMTIAEVQAALGQDGYLRSESVSALHSSVTVHFGYNHDRPQASAYFYDGVLMSWEPR